ncbi:alpha-L-arabinofuranosidase [Moorena producens JHB]|uniref:Alpha-L-arabinofuranosidase n=1 Tax=Moorena producens (strain JHB) TaxID=1454205 RepID=A0A1D9G3T2_MOOP1|nr:alpha-L-arabinofuranosidase [Moorena producens]AOY82278.1 alpha-L-arabinofuranosidase [Moorena producens JHB]
MKRRTLLQLALSGAAIAFLLPRLFDKQSATNSVRASPIQNLWLSGKSINTKVRVDWTKPVAQTTPFTFGSNDYEITILEKASDSVFQEHLAELDIRLIRIHHIDLCERWTNEATKTWDEAKIQACYDASYPQQPTIIQNIPRWPSWMATEPDGLLSTNEYDNYAAFCAQLVEILNGRQQRQIRYWEPLNEQDVPYQKAGKLNQLWEIYNKVARAMKAVDPSIKVGGPVLTWDEPYRLEDFLKKCASNVDFISWHRYGSGNARESTDTLMSYTPEYRRQVENFREIVAKYIPDRKVPLLLGEYNINYSWNSGEDRQNTHVGAVWFASVFKHLADAGIDMATSWHLKDMYYGMIDHMNNLRPAATVFRWAIKYLTGKVMYTESGHKFVEAMAIEQSNEQRSLLLINKSAKPASIRIEGALDFSDTERLPMFSLDANGVKSRTLATRLLKYSSVRLNPYSLVLLRLSN